MSVSDVIAEALDQDLEELFQEHYAMAYRTAYGVIGTSQDAEDVAQIRQMGRERTTPSSTWSGRRRTEGASASTAAR